MDRRVAVNFTGGRLQDLELQPLGEPEHVDGADDAGLGRLHRILLVMDGRGRTGEVEDLIHLDEQRMRDVVTQKLEAFVVEEMRDVAARAREEIIDAENLAARLEQPVTEVRA